MENLSIEQLNEMQMDVLKELGNIGAGNAATALSSLIAKKVDMGVPLVKILDIGNITEILGGAENPVVGILLQVVGDISGMMMFVLEQTSAHVIVNMLMGRTLTDFSEFEDMDRSALQEIGNIMAGSYLNSLSTLTNLKIIPSIPHLAIDMAGAILSVPAIEFGKMGDKVLFIESEFIEGADQVTGYFILIPDLESLNKIMTILGVNEV